MKKFEVKVAIVLFAIGAVAYVSAMTCIDKRGTASMCQEECLPYAAKRIEGECFCAVDTGWERTR